MLKKHLKKILPEKEVIAEHKHLQIFGKLLHDQNLWHINRRSVPKAFAIGLMCAWIPVPFQMVLAAGAAIAIHANIIISVALVWITNPVTMPALFYFAYKVGSFILNREPIPFPDDNSVTEWITILFTRSWRPFLLGCAILGIISSAIGYITTSLLWRWMIIRHWRHRHQRRAKKHS